MEMRQEISQNQTLVTAKSYGILPSCQAGALHMCNTASLALHTRLFHPLPLLQEERRSDSEVKALPLCGC